MINGLNQQTPNLDAGNRVSTRQAETLRRLQAGDARFASTMRTQLQAKATQAAAEPATTTHIQPTAPVAPQAQKRVSPAARAAQQTNPTPVATQPDTAQPTRPGILGGQDLNRLVLDVQKIAQKSGFVGLSQDAVIRAYHHGESLLVDTRA